MKNANHSINFKTLEFHGKTFTGDSAYIHRVSSYYENTNKCNHCQASFDYHNRKLKFCSNSCAASHNNAKRIRSEESKKKTSNALLGFKQSEATKLKRRKPRGCRRPLVHCIICGNITTNFRKTCSNACLSSARYKTSKKGYYKGFHCDSRFELAFLIFHLDHGHNVEKCNKTLNYIFEGKSLQYTPDFIVDDVLIEIKGYLDPKSQAKQNQHPEVRMLNGHDIKHMIEYVQTTYNVKDVMSMYDGSGLRNRT